MANSTSTKALQGQSIPRRSFTRKKEEHLPAKHYLDFLAHYDVELVQTDGPITVVRCKTGTELRLEPKGKLQMLTLLLGEFGTLSRPTKRYRTTKSHTPESFLKPEPQYGANMAYSQVTVMRSISISRERF